MSRDTVYPTYAVLFNANGTEMFRFRLDPRAIGWDEKHGYPGLRGEQLLQDVLPPQLVPLRGQTDGPGWMLQISCGPEPG